MMSSTDPFPNVFIAPNAVAIGTHSEADSLESESFVFNAVQSALQWDAFQKVHKSTGMDVSALLEMEFRHRIAKRTVLPPCA
jgi:hypothetical protein